MIRPFVPSDMERVLSIWLEASIQAHDFAAKEFWESKVSDMRELYIPGSDTYVYSDHGQVKGFFSLQEDTLAALFVYPGAQREGIGGQLIEKAKSLRKRLRLTVYRHNRNSIDFYRKNGFSVVGEKIDEHTGSQEILMEYGL
jgi:putative acetyltransferase